MKKYIFILITLFIIIIKIEVNASTWSYKWSNTTIEIPVGSNIYDYEKIPQAKLYKDNVELTDADIKIVSTGDWLYYLVNVNTNVVGEYHVWYKAYEYNYMPGTCHDYKCLVTFKVVDKEKPIITPLFNNIRIARGTKNIDLSRYFNVSDNYDEDLTVIYNHSIDTTKAGLYQCEMVVVDDYKNEEKYTFNVEVYNTGNPPKIELLTDNIRIKTGTKIDLTKYFRVTDDDLDVVKTQITHNIDNMIPGIYQCEVTASDQYDVVKMNFTVEIYEDNIEPTIIKLSDEIKIEYGGKVELSNYFIIMDDYDTDIKPIFIHNINVNQIGVYECKIVAIDSSGKRSELIFSVEVYGDLNPPTITLEVENIRIKRKSAYDLSKYFSVDDNSGKVSFEFYHQIDIETIGFYECKMVAKDSKGNISVYSFVVEIYDDNPPVISFYGEGYELNLYLKEEVNIKTYFKAIDDIDGDITNNIIFPPIDKKTPKVVDYKVMVSDYAGNMSELTIKLNVIDDIEPEIILYNESITLDYGFDMEKLDPLSYVKSFTDNNLILDKQLINVSTNLTNEVGEYYIIYSYSDTLNTVIKEIKVTVLSVKAPTITAPIITMKKEEIHDLYNYVEVYDESDSNVCNTLIIDDSSVDYTKPGKYQASAYAVNSSGLSSTITFYIVVEDKNIFDNDIVKIISISLVVLLITSLGIIYFKKNKNTKIV